MDERAIKLWAFDDAPEQYRKLSEHGGDEDWVIFIPALPKTSEGDGGRWPYPISEIIDAEGRDYIDLFGFTDRHDLPNGDLVVIFAHA